jgi:hypothetical protein
MHTATRAALGGGGFGGGDPRCGGLRASGGGDDGAASTNLDIPCEGGEDDATVPTMPTVSTLKRKLQAFVDAGMVVYGVAHRNTRRGAHQNRLPPQPL